ncbi:MAG: tRNA (adenosine(37)-N6)-threonylcarbamoyltransferase complex transferase subunit TsaD [Patescibacteria group bacterium]
MKILGIESSCDETAGALLEVKNKKVEVLANTVASQIKIHQKFGGVVPELAARNHLKNIIPVLEKTLGDSKDFDAIAVAHGPGLVTSLFVGIEAGKTLAFLWNKPLVAVNHMEAHIYANWIEHAWDEIKFPAMCLITSGGHTEIVLMENEIKMKRLGQTIDDAGGEAFDKVAKILGLPYPGGPNIEKTAQTGDSKKYAFPRPLINKPNFDFSFSGLKTSVLYFMRDNFGDRKPNPEELADICASFQKAVTEVLVSKTLKAAKKYQAQTLMLAGGVAANQALRRDFETEIAKQKLNFNFIYPSLKYCTDNASMVAMAGYFKAQQKKFTPIHKLVADPGLDVK